MREIAIRNEHITVQSVIEEVIRCIKKATCDLKDHATYSTTWIHHTANDDIILRRVFELKGYRVKTEFFGNMWFSITVSWGERY